MARKKNQNYQKKRSLPPEETLNKRQRQDDSQPPSRDLIPIMPVTAAPKASNRIQKVRLQQEGAQQPEERRSVQVSPPPLAESGRTSPSIVFGNHTTLINQGSLAIAGNDKGEAANYSRSDAGLNNRNTYFATGTLLPTLAPPQRSLDDRRSANKGNFKVSDLPGNLQMKWHAMFDQFLVDYYFSDGLRTGTENRQAANELWRKEFPDEARDQPSLMMSQLRAVLPYLCAL
jgi:hypothetical protein